jgi:hypothetical protein
VDQEQKGEQVHHVARQAEDVHHLGGALRSGGGGGSSGESN